MWGLRRWQEMAQTRSQAEGQEIAKMRHRIERKGPRHPAARAIASLCDPPPARPLPLHQPAPLRVISLARTQPQQSRLHINLQAVRPGPRFRAFPLHRPGTCLRPFSLPGLGLKGLGYLPKCVYFEIARRSALAHAGYPRGSPLSLST